MIYRLIAGGPELGPIAIAAIENLAQAGANGQNCIFGERDLLMALSAEERLSGRARSYFRMLAQLLTQYGSLFFELPCMKIDISDESGVAVGSEVVPVGLFANPEYCEKAQLLVENITDFEVLFELAKIYANKYLGGLVVNLRAQMGGGSTTGPVLSHILSSPSGPVLCVVDSDRKFKGARVGDTARGVKASLRRSRDKWRAKLFVMEQRELENLVPREVREICCASLEKETIKLIPALDAVNAVYSDYCCLKNGDSTCGMVTSALSKRRTEVIDLLAVVEAHGLPSVHPCGTCPLPNGCFHSPGLGKAFLERVSAALRSGRIHTDLERWRTELKEIVAMVVHAGLAITPLRG